MFNFLRVLLAGLFLFSSGAFAQDYYWTASKGAPGQFPSATAACEAQALPPWSFASLESFSDTKKFCLLSMNGGEPIKFVDQYATRAGSECPINTEYNSETGECVPEPIQCEAGLKAGPFKFNGYLNAGGFMIEDPAPPTATCISSCQYILDFKGSCYSGDFGNYCVRTYTSTGDNCVGSGDGTGSGSSGDGDGPDAPPADPSDYDDNGDPQPAPDEPYPCTKRTDAEGRQTLDCSPPRDDSDKCPNGYVWTGTFCAKPPKPPTDPTDPTDPSNPGDGGSDGSGDEKGLAKDSTLKSIEGKIDTTNSKLTGIDGKLGASNTLLQGIKDAIGNIPGGGGGNNSGEGEGEEEPKVANGLGCSQDLDCSGDPIQCATLRINKEHLCQTQLTAEAEQQINDALYGDGKGEMSTTEVEVGGLFQEGLSAARWLPSGACPTPESVSVFGRSYFISWEPLCRFAAALSNIIKALASIFFVVYIGKGLKGS